MPVVLGETIPAAPASPPRKRWTRQEIEFFESSGAMDGQHFELIDGDLINKMGKHLRHTLAIKRAVNALAQVFGWSVILSETSISVAPEDNPTSNPEPDVIVLTRDPVTITTNQPDSTDVALVLEVADSTLKFDLSTKAALYARAGIADYWVLDLTGARLIVHRQPSAGVYKSVVAYAGPERIAPLAAPGHDLAAAELLN